MIRYYRDLNNGVLHSSKNVYFILPEFDSPSVTDKSSYQPNIDHLHQSPIINGGSGSRSPLYDFEDGKDTGVRLYQLRDPSADVTEIQETQKKLKKAADSDTKEANEILEKHIKEVEKKSSDSVSSPASPSE